MNFRDSLRANRDTSAFVFSVSFLINLPAVQMHSHLQSESSLYGGGKVIARLNDESFKIYPIFLSLIVFSF